MHNLFQVILKEYFTDKKRSEADDGAGLLLLNLLSISSYYFLIVRIIVWFLLFSLRNDVMDFFKFSKKWIVGGKNVKLKQKFLDNQKGKNKKT